MWVFNDALNFTTYYFISKETIILILVIHIAKFSLMKRDAYRFVMQICSFIYKVNMSFTVLKCAFPLGVKTLPFGVRSIKPIFSR